MPYIFLDESGDLGFDFSKKKTSKNFVITFLFLKSKSSVESIVKKIFRSFNKKELKRHSGVLHAFKETSATRKKLLSMLGEKDVSIISIYLNKRKVYTKMKDEKHVLYNYFANILLDRVFTKKLIPINQPIHLIASRRETNKFLNQNFKNYLESKFDSKHRVKLIIEIKNPSEEKCLQTVDFVCWAIFRQREHNDDTYYNIIKSKIVEESGLFP
ncbi:MAG: DUF3800 domain-containing protein [Ignavibacteriae bacterium]|nr:DUF3800 domain-containing protein [Ignavibacteriota bacterium]